MQQPEVNQQPCSRVALSFSCRDLSNLDIMSKSDPMIALFSKRDHLPNAQWFEVGRTEMIKDNQSPDFTTLIEIDYFFEEVQSLRIMCVDIDDFKSQDLNRQDFIGSIETRLSNILTSSGQQLTLPLKKGNSPHGIVIVRAEEVIASKQSVVFHFAGEKLDKKDFFGKSDPFLKFFRARENGVWEAIHSTEIIKQDLNPVWKRFTIPVSKLCNTDFDRPILIECHDWDSDGSTDFIGSTQVSLRGLLGPQRAYVLNNDKKSKGKTAAGTLKVLDIQLLQEHSFLDYIFGGCEISLITAIDFTASNKDPHDPTSLHFLDPSKPNQYEQAIRAVGNILGPYDSDGIIPTFGFGAKWGGQVHHCFPLVPVATQHIPHCALLSFCVPAKDVFCLRPFTMFLVPLVSLWM
eukprot:c12566_g1_i3.p1 GENE.c12566_g1_i3~~c12566_g1_i3.p1  ORF type:complete len:419 (+),score=106.01 c12566_g1_i3:44-1258(+)